MIGQALSSEKIVVIETCPRRYKWTERYRSLRVSPIRALYMALDAGLRAEKSWERAAENQFLSLAASPGLDITGRDVYAVAMHHAKLAAIITVALRSTSSEPWKPVVADGWSSACYENGDGVPRRIALVDHWSDDRKRQEIYGWRSIGETVMMGRPISLTAIVIGSVREKRRHSPWTRGYRHPKNKTFRLQRTASEEDFSHTWKRFWREDSDIPTATWLMQMTKDGCMGEVVHSIHLPIPVRINDYLASLDHLRSEMDQQNDTPAMKLSGCFGYSPCPFVCVCHGSKPPIPESYGFVPISSLERPSPQ